MSDGSPKFDLNQADGLIAFYKAANSPHFFSGVLQRSLNESYHCPKCGGFRKHQIFLQMHSATAPLNYIERGGQVKHGGIHEKNLNYASELTMFETFCPALFIYRCTQCGSKNIALLRIDAESKLQLSVHQDGFGGLSTPHTPTGVRYYLDQAMRAEQSGARSAAAAMYRAALEQLLFEQGFQKGMLNDKIIALSSAISAGTCPRWAKELDTDFLDYLKGIGNGSIHPNGGDIKKQAAIDEELLRAIHEVFSALLDLVYELPHRKASLKGKLSLAAATLKK